MFVDTISNDVVLMACVFVSAMVQVHDEVPLVTRVCVCACKHLQGEAQLAMAPCFCLCVQECNCVVIVQEYAAGGDLLRFMFKCGGRLPERQAVNLVLQPFLSALLHLHSQVGPGANSLRIRNKCTLLICCTCTSRWALEQTSE